MLSNLLHSVHWRHDACRTLHTVLQDAWHAAVSANGVVIAYSPLLTSESAVPSPPTARHAHIVAISTESFGTNDGRNPNRPIGNTAISTPMIT